MSASFRAVNLSLFTQLPTQLHREPIERKRERERAAQPLEQLTALVEINTLLGYGSMRLSNALH